MAAVALAPCVKMFNAVWFAAAAVPETCTLIMLPVVKDEEAAYIPVPVVKLLVATESADEVVACVVFAEVSINPVPVAAPREGVTSDGEVAKTDDPVPVSSDREVINCADVIEPDLVLNNVLVPAGMVALLAAVEVKVNANAPEVMSDELFARVSVAAEAGAVSVSLLKVPAVNAPVILPVPVTSNVCDGLLFIIPTCC